MRSDVDIRVENLGKLYRIGAPERYRTFRDTLTEAVTKPFRRLRDLFSRNGASPPNSIDNTIWALKNVSFEVKRGEVIGIIGRNGAGKSTLLKILSRITEPTEGFAEIRGRVGSLLEVGTGFHPELTGRENIYLNGAILGMHRSEIKRKFDEIVAFSEVEKFIDTPVKHFSSGMYLRLAFAVAAHLEPEILMVDEVLAVGDAAFQKKCLGKMGDVAKEGRTIFFVSHNMAAINRLCSRAIWLQNGQVKEVGLTKEIVSNYLVEGISGGGQIFFERRPNAPVQFRSACITNSKGIISQSIPDDEGFTIELEVEAHEATSDIYFGIILQNLEGINVLFADSRDVEHSMPSKLRSGRYRICVDFPAIFAPGGYCLVLGIATRLSITQLDYIEGACSFEIVKNSNMQRTASNPGIIKLNLPWKLEEHTE